MLGHNIGMCEALKGLLHKCKSLLRPDGQLLVNSAKNQDQQITKAIKVIQGELEFRLSHEKKVCPWMRWLHVDFDTLALHSFE